MPEVWLVVIVFLLAFSLFWAVVEIGIKWLILYNLLVWRNVWLPLFNSILIQLLQALGVVLALIPSSQVLESQGPLASDSANFVLSILAFVFLKFMMDTTIGGIFLSVVKKNSDGAWRASLTSSFVSAFFLGSIFLIIASL